MVWHVNGTPTNIMRCADSSTLTSQEYPKRWALRRGGVHPPMCNAECVVWPSARRLACLSASSDHMFQKLLKILGSIKKMIYKTCNFYTVSEKRLANLHFFKEKWPNVT